MDWIEQALAVALMALKVAIAAGHLWRLVRAARRRGPRKEADTRINASTR